MCRAPAELDSHENVLGRPLDNGPELVTARIEVQRSGDDEFQQWLQVVADSAEHLDTEGLPAREEFPQAGYEAAERDMAAAGRALRRAARRGVHRRDVVRWIIRNGIVYVATGAYVATRRRWEARTNARYERLMRSSEAVGAYERLTDWEARAEQARERRHRRRMDWITAPLDVARAIAVVAMSGVGLLLALGVVLAVAHRDASWLLTPMQKVVDATAWLVWLLGVVWLPATLVAPGLLLAGLWQLGRQHGKVPRWAAPAGARDHPTVVVTPGGIATALAHLGIPAMNRAVKEGWRVEFATPPVRVNGRGYQATFSLPMGVTPEMIAYKREVLAHNLVRAPLEVWPTAAERAGCVDLWVTTHLH